MKRYRHVVSIILSSLWVAGWALGRGFNETWTAADGSLWPAYWSSSDTNKPNYTLDIVSGQGRYTRFGDRMAWVNTEEAMDLDQKVMFRWGGGNNAGFALIARRKDIATNTYYLSQLNASTTLRVGRTVTGGTTWLSTRSDVTGFTGSTNWWMRFTVSTTGSVTYLACTIWPTNGNESAGYTVSASDTNLSLQKVSGRFGMIFSVNSRTIYVDDYTVRWPSRGSTIVIIQ